MSTNTYRIVLENSTQSKNSPVANLSSSLSEPKYTTGQLRTQTALKAIVAYDKYVAPFVEQAIQYQVSTIELRTGARELQQRVEFGLSITKSAVGIVSSVATGYAMGNLPGAVIAGIISIGTTAMNYANRERTIRTQGSLESITQQGYALRAGGYAPTSIQSRSRTQ